MPTGSFDYSPGAADLAEWATPLLVCRYDRSQPSGQRYTYLPNVFVEQVQVKEGSEPPTVQFRYILDGGDSGYPSTFDALFPISATPNPYRVRAGDELVVLWIDPDGDYRVLWDGFAQLPQADVSGRSQEVTFVGVHASVRLWDDVVTGRWQRDGDDPETPGDPYQTQLPTRFNPDDEPNCTPDGHDEQDEESGAEWPVFLEPKLQPKDDGTTYQTYWDLSKFARYMLWYHNDEKFVDNPDFGVLDDLLSCRAPLKGQEFYDPDDASTYTESKIVIRDLDAANRPPMEVVGQQLAYAGFRMRFVTEGTPADSSPPGMTVEEPTNRIEVYRFDAGSSAMPKEVMLGEVGAAVDPAASNTEGLHAANDFQAVANRWTVESRPIRYEIGVLLAPGFSPAAGDESTTNRKKWLRSNQDSATKGDREKYRLYLADECGEGHWDLKLKQWTTGQSLLLADLFEDDDTNPGGEYARRYRPGINTLFSLDPAGRPYKAQLKVSRDYAGESPPCLWDGTGTWQAIDGGWRLLRDRLGIMIDIENPMEWDIGKPKESPAQEPSGVLDAVTSIANPGTAQRQKLFYLMLVVVIEGDRMIDATADSRPASPYPFTVSRQVDAKDHFQQQIVAKSSPFNTKGSPQKAKDDSDRATTYAEQMRGAHEFPPVSATVTIPWFTTAYQVGDRISSVSGRDMSLQANAGTEQGEAPAYPYIVGVNWTFGDGPKTVLQLSDRRSEPAPFAHSHYSGR